MGHTAAARQSPSPTLLGHAVRDAVFPLQMCLLAPVQLG